MNPKVSVIVPCYNAAHWVDGALACLCGQSLRDIEIICVNDGSTDDTLHALERWAEKDPRIKVINNKKNMGSGRSRNFGIAAARAEYIGLMDADDTVDYNFYELLHAAAIRKNADVTVSNLRMVTSLGKHIGHRMRSMFHIMRNPELWFSYSYCAIYKKEFLKKNKIEFFPTSLMDDTYFEYMVRFAPNTIWAFEPDAYYNYLRNEESISSFYMPESKIEVTLRVTTAITELMNAANVHDELYAKSYLAFFNHATVTYPMKNSEPLIRMKISKCIIQMYHNFRHKEIIRKAYSRMYPYLQSNDPAGLLRELDYLSHHEIFEFRIFKKILLYRIVQHIGNSTHFLFGKIQLMSFRRKIESRFEAI